MSAALWTVVGVGAVVVGGAWLLLWVASPELKSPIDFGDIARKRK